MKKYLLKYLAIKNLLTFFIPFVICTASQAVPPEYQYLEKDGLKYILYHPAPNALVEGEVYPLVLYLHGSCSECITHERIAIESNLMFWHNYSANTQPIPTFIIAPAGGTGGWTGESRRNTIFSIIDELVENKPIDTQRIYITGFSMGANGTWNYIQYRPNFFAAANPQGINPSGLNAQLVKDTPIWATIGALDSASRVNGLTEAVAAIRSANGDDRGGLTWVTGVNPRFNIFPGADHGQAQVATQNTPGFKDWMYNQILDGNRTPNIRFVSPERFAFFQNGNSIPFELAYSDADGDEMEVSIAVNGDVQEGALSNASEGTLSITEIGVYEITATATDTEGKSATATLQISVGTPITELQITRTNFVLKEGNRRQEVIRFNRVGTNPDTTTAVEIGVTFSGTANYGVDYVASETLGQYKDGLVTIPVGQTRGSIVLQVIDDLEDQEEDETIIVTAQEALGLVFNGDMSVSTTVENTVLVFDSLFEEKTDVGGGIRDANDTGLGWVWDSHYPFVYSWKLATATSDGWIYIYPLGASEEGFFAWSFGAGQWFWTSFAYEGFVHFFGEGPLSGWIHLDSFAE